VADLRSIELLLIEARAEREERGRQYETLEVRAGVVLGFAGVLIVSLRGRTWLTSTAVVLAVLAALAALWAFFPRLRPHLDLRKVSDRYESAEAPFTFGAVLDAQIRSWELLVEAIWIKARRLRIAMALLSSSVVFVAGERLIR
jgi:hypothetical protein